MRSGLRECADERKGGVTGDRGSHERSHERLTGVDDE